MCCNIVTTKAGRRIKSEDPAAFLRKGEESVEENRREDLPEAFCRKMEGLLGSQYQAFLESYEKARSQGLRLNFFKSERTEDWIGESLKLLEKEKMQLEPVPWAREGFYYQEEERPGRHPFHDAGLYYIQEPSAMAVVQLLDPQPGERILDLCAAPGGKTTHAASRLKGKGFLLSNEIHPARARILSQNVERMGIWNCAVTNQSPEELSGRFQEFFHGIIVDAPCSGEGMFRKESEAVKEWSEEQVRICAQRQRRILEEASRMLCPGGRLVYSTCTFSPEENEGTIGDFLRDHPEFHTEPAPEYPGFSKGMYQWTEGKADGDEQGLRNTVRIFPHQARGEGHFIALLKKEGELTEQEAAPAVRSFPAPAEYLTFARENLRAPQALEGEGEYLLFGDQLYRAPACLGNVKGLKVLRPGLHLGTVKKNRFEPAHALAMALRPEETVLSISLDPDGEEIRRYLSGEALPADWKKWPHLEGKKGWVLVCLGHCSAGWAKLSGNALKNHYPKGLRRNAAV